MWIDPAADLKGEDGAACDFVAFNFIVSEISASLIREAPMLRDKNIEP